MSTKREQGHTGITAGRIEMFLHAKVKDGLKVQTINHLRAYISRSCNAAIKAGRYHQGKPVTGVKKCRVVPGKPDDLRDHEVMQVFNVLPQRWIALFATAVYTGLRKGELAGLRKCYLDLHNQLLVVARAYERETTKGGHTDVIPISTNLLPYLAESIAAAPGALVFPRPDGTILSHNSPFEEVLRRALAHAGIVEGYNHVCRSQNCGHRQLENDAELRRCPNDNRKLWLQAIVRKILFHDLRHTTASLLMMRGANPVAVQRIMRHSDPKIATEVYGHLAPGYLQAEANRLTFNPRHNPTPQTIEAMAAGDTPPFVTPLLPGQSQTNRRSVLNQ